jgi:hypothetical protein
MGLDDAEDAARGEEVGDDLRPANEVGQPAEHAVRGEDHVEAVVEAIAECVDIALDEGRGHPHLRGEPARGLDGRGGEVDAGRPRPPSGPADGIHAEVALQVEERPARDVPDETRLELVEHRRPVHAARLEALDVVELGGDVQRRPGIP